MKITRIYRGVKSNRINVDLDEEFGFSVEEATLIKFNLFVDKEIDNIEREKIEESDRTEYLYKKALEHIARRPRSESELRQFLDKKSEKRFKNVEEGLIAKALEKLKEKGHLNDTEFAKWFVDLRLKQQKQSIYGIRSELIQKFGVRKEIIEDVLEKLNARDKESEAIENLINKKFGQYQSKYKDERIAKEKMLQYLSNKGFSWDTVREVLK